MTETRRSDQLCESCRSHIAARHEDGHIIYECSYCGEIPEDVDISNLIEDGAPLWQD
jgi:ribosomal protein L37AE/L43A